MSMVTTLAVSRPALAAFAVMGVLWGSFAAILPDTKAMLGVDEATLGLTMLGAPICAVLAMLVAPTTGAALGRFALPGATLAMALAFALPGQFAQVWAFALALALCGATTGTLDVLMNARVAALENDRDLHLMNLAHAAYSLGYGAGALGTGALRSQGWTPGMVFALASVVCVGLALVTYERHGRIDGLTKPKGSAAVGLGWVPVIGGAMVMIAFMTENATESWSALHIEKTLGGTPAQGSFGPALMALTMAASRLAGQGIIAHVSALRLLIGGAVLAAIGAVIAALAVSPMMAYAGFVIMGIGASVLAPTAFSLVGRMAEPKARARAVARATLLGYFGYFFGPPTLGFIAGHFGLRASFLFAAALLLVVLVLAPLLVRVRPSHPQIP